MDLPYAHTSSGAKARAEIIDIRRHFGATQVGFMDEFDTHTVILAFRLHDRPVQLRATAQGWANTYLKQHPWNSRKQISEAEWKDRAFRQGLIAVNSILRDWVKGQVTAIETGILTFEHVFMPYIMLPDGRSLGDHAQKLLSAPEGN